MAPGSGSGIGEFVSPSVKEDPGKQMPACLAGGGGSPGLPVGAKDVVVKGSLYWKFG